MIPGSESRVVSQVLRVILRYFSGSKEEAVVDKNTEQTRKNTLKGSWVIIKKLFVWPYKIHF